MELQTDPIPNRQQRLQIKFQFDELIPAISPDLFAVLTFLIIGWAWIGSIVLLSRVVFRIESKSALQG